jgi:hypothetical protein
VKDEGGALGREGEREGEREREGGMDDGGKGGGKERGGGGFPPVPLCKPLYCKYSSEVGLELSVVPISLKRRV